MPTLNYIQTLEMAETFMEVSGIRAFCTNMCKGDCCGGCYEDKDACHKHEGRRVSCSTFLCWFKTTGKDENLMAPFRSADRIIGEEASRIYHKYRTGYIRTNRYYHPPPKQMFTNFEIAAVPGPACLEEQRTNIVVVRAGLSLTYARKVKVVMNKVTRLAHKVLATRDSNDRRDGVRLSMFDVKRKKIRKRHVWIVEYYGGP